MSKKVLLVDDDVDFCGAASQMLQLCGHQVSTCHSVKEASQAVAEASYDHIFLDFMLPDGSGLHLIDAMKTSQSRAAFVTLITGHPSVKTIVSGFAGPKVNYLVKPLTKEALDEALSDNKPKGVQRETTNLHFDCLVGESPAMHQLYEMIEKVSRTGANVMLLGESGVGKEMIAQAIHNTSEVKGELVAANCGAFAKDLIGSELFGHEKGAFTGAVGRKQGLFEQAKEGTLFLDEITEMPLDSQPNLLRVLETGRVTRVGGTSNFPVECRVISATNRSEQEIATDKVLREDLYFRLAVFPIKIPPLRQRRGDVAILAEHFLDLLNEEHETRFEWSREQIARLNAYPWPGNVRELRHTIHRAYIMSDRDQSTVILPDDFSSPFSKTAGSTSAAGAAFDNQNGIEAGQKIEDVERELIRVTLEQLDGDKPAAAQMLGISLKTLYNRINKYEEVDEHTG